MPIDRLRVRLYLLFIPGRDPQRQTQAFSQAASATWYVFLKVTSSPHPEHKKKKKIQNKLEEVAGPVNEGLSEILACLLDLLSPHPHGQLWKYFRSGFNLKEPVSRKQQQPTQTAWLSAAWRGAEAERVS